MKVLSLFDGMSCGRVALERAGIPVTQYFASEIDKYAMKVTQANHPDNIQIGDVRIVRQMAQAGVFGDIDFLIGGSPCQNLSFAGKQSGLSTVEGIEVTSLEHYKSLVAADFKFKGQSYLFWEYVWIREILKPRFWLLENVKMNKKWLKVFNEIMGVDGVLINSALVSAQNRQRYYWCNWEVEQPEDRGIYLKDVIEDGCVDREKSYCIDANYHKGTSLENYLKKARRQNNLSPCKVVNVNPSGNGMNGWIYDTDAKSPTLTTNKGEGLKITGGKTGYITTIQKNSTVNKNGLILAGHATDINGHDFLKRVYDIKGKCRTLTAGGGGNTEPKITQDNITYRKLTPVECERLQGLPDDYSNHVSNSQRYKMLGNGWQVDTIVHIFQELLRTNQNFALECMGVNDGI